MKGRLSMIGVAILRVTYEGKEPYLHRHTWMSEGFLYAPVEIADWIQQTQKEQNCTLEIVEWSLEERTDIGY